MGLVERSGSDAVDETLRLVLEQPTRVVTNAQQKRVPTHVHMDLHELSAGRGSLRLVLVHTVLLVKRYVGEKSFEVLC